MVQDIGYSSVITKVLGSELSLLSYTYKKNTSVKRNLCKSFSLVEADKLDNEGVKVRLRMVKWLSVKTPSTKPADLSSIPRAHMVVRKQQLLQAVLLSSYSTTVCVYP